MLLSFNFSCCILAPLATVYDALRCQVGLSFDRSLVVNGDVVQVAHGPAVSGRRRVTRRPSLATWPRRRAMYYWASLVFV